MRTIPVGSSASLAALATPTTNWAMLMRAQDQNLQLQNYSTAQQEQQLVEEQSAQAQQEQVFANIQALPLERPDKQRIKRWLETQRSEVKKRLRDNYQGNMTQFMKAEGSAWMQNTLSALQNSPEYLNGVKNKEQILMAQKAIQDGENLIGKVDSTGGVSRYVPATKLMEDFYSGKTPTFEFKGSYKDDDDLIKHFSSQYAPGKLPFEKTMVSDEDKQAYLLATKSPEVATDMWLRKFQNTPIYYKTKSLDEFYDFQNKQKDQAIQEANYATKTQMDKLRFGIMGKQSTLLDQKIAKNANEGKGGGQASYLKSIIPTSKQDTQHEFNPTVGANTLPYSGYDRRNFGGDKTGVVKLNSLDIFGKESVSALGQMIGADKVAVTKEHPTGWAGGQIKEGFLASGGFSALDLASVNHSIVTIDNKIYTNPREFGPNGQANSANGFLGVTIRLADGDDAKKLGLTGFLGRDTELGSKAKYNSDKREIKIYTPIGDIYKNEALDRYLSNESVGTKTTNDYMNPFVLGLDDDY